ncbi:MAG: hypothetical protein P8X68_20640 [Desulfobacterales bacterium]|jgi:hypothetical protein
MSIKLPVHVLVALAMIFLILVFIVPSAVADDSANKVELYSDVPDWAKKQYGQSVIGLNVIAGNYKLINGTTLKAGSEVFVLEKWMTFQTGLIIDVAKGGVKLRDKFYPDGTELFINKSGNIVQRSE